MSIVLAKLVTGEMVVGEMNSDGSMSNCMGCIVSVNQQTKEQRLNMGPLLPTKSAPIEKIEKSKVAYYGNPTQEIVDLYDRTTSSIHKPSTTDVQNVQKSKLIT